MVRPELYHIYPLVLQFLKANNYHTIFSSTIQVTPNQYWATYPHVIGQPILEKLIRARAISYLNGQCYLIVFKDLNNRFDGNTLSENIKKYVKGTEGVKDDKTLRGGIVYADVQHTVKCLSLSIDVGHAIDPIQQHYYSNISLNPNAIQCKYTANLPGIHTPEKHEIQRDFGILFSKQNLIKLLNITS